LHFFFPVFNPAMNLSIFIHFIANTH